MSQVGFMVLDFVFRLGCILFLARFLLQACNADFYNPLSQAVVKATNPLCNPLRAILPNSGRWDVASLLVAWLVSVAFIGVLIGLSEQVFAPLTLLLGGLLRTALVLTQFYWWTILITIIASWITQGQYNPVIGLLNQLTEPLLAPVRRVLPNFGPLDLSPMLVLLGLIVLETLIRGVQF
ncbi:MAG: YggT family protein [Pseudomonadota bacterium]